MHLHVILLAAACSVFAAAARADVDVLINEVDADQVGVDSAEFVELYNAGGGLPLQRYFLVFYNGAVAGDPEYRSVSLAGHVVPPDGLFVIGAATVPGVDFTPPGWPATNAIQNGADAVALWFDSTGLLTSGSFAGTGAATPPPGAVLVDAIVHDTGDADDAALLAALTPGQLQLDEGGSGLGTTESIQRIPDGGLPLETAHHFTKAPSPGLHNGPGAPWNNLGCALAGTAGRPKLAGTGVLVAGTPGALTLSDARPSSPAVLFVSLTDTPVPFKGGTLKPLPFLLVLNLFTGPGGSLALPWASWPAGLEGFSFYTQLAILDPAAPQGLALSNALQGTPAAALPHPVPEPAALAAGILDHVAELTTVVQAALPAADGGRTLLTYIRDETFPLFVLTLKEELVLKQRHAFLPAVSAGAASGFAGIDAALATMSDAALYDALFVSADLGLLGAAFPASEASLQAQLAAQTDGNGFLLAGADISGVLWSLLTELLDCIPGLQELLNKLLGYAHDVAHISSPAVSVPAGSVAAVMQTVADHSAVFVAGAASPAGGRAVLEFARDVTWPLWFDMADFELAALGLTTLGPVLTHFEGEVTQDINALLLLPDPQLNALVYAHPADLQFAAVNLDLLPRLQEQLAAQTTLGGGLAPGSTLAAVSWDNLTLVLKCLPDEFRKVLELIHKILHGSIAATPTANALEAMDILDDLTTTAIGLQFHPQRGRQFLMFMQADTLPRTLAILQNEMTLVAPELAPFYAAGQSASGNAIATALALLPDNTLNQLVYDEPDALGHSQDFQFATFGNPTTSELALDAGAVWDQLVEYLSCFLKKWWKWCLQLVHLALHL